MFSVSLEIPRHRWLELQLAESAAFIVSALADAEQVGGCRGKGTPVLCGLLPINEFRPVVAQAVGGQPLDCLALLIYIAFNHFLVPDVGHILTDAVLVVGHKYALPVAAVLGIERHRRVEGRAGAGEEVEDGGVFIWEQSYQIMY